MLCYYGEQRSIMWNDLSGRVSLLLYEEYMDYLDSHLHLTDLTWENMYTMSTAGIKTVVSPVILGAIKPVSHETIRDMWDHQLEIQLVRTSEHCIKSYAMIGIAMVSTPRDNLPLLLEWLEEYLHREEVVALGEVGIEPSSKTADIDEQETILTGQLEVAKRVGKPVCFHTPPWNENKTLYSKKLLQLCRDHSLRMNKVIFDHCSEANIEAVLDSGAYAAITVQPWRNMSPEVAADLVINYGADRIMIDSDCGSSRSDPLAVPKTALALQKKGASQKTISMVCYENGKKAYSLR